ncbi:MAG: hypothetical protein H6652_21895 [Ardenticatenaceae bacterium]|nr:hypothetical protein [Ardenticatenaceae bacterium]
MLRVQFNNGAPLRIKLPRANTKQAVLDLAQAFVAYEATRPEASRTPYTARIETAVTAALAAQDAAQDQEAARKAASEALKRTEQAVRRTVRQLRSLLAGHFAATPERAQAWGFYVRQTGRSAGQILMPQARPELLACLNEYIATETARPEAERFTQPPLAEVVTLRDNLVQQQQSRNQAHQSRLQENGRSSNLNAQLFEDLRLALTYLMVVEFAGEPDRMLAQWGFEVVARSRTTREDASEPSPEGSVPEAV